jgi:Autophagy protein 16 (ATG16)
MHDIQQQLVDRNNRETVPFVSVYEAYSSLLNQIDALQLKCSGAELEASSLRQQLLDSSGTAKGSSQNNVAIKSALKNEARLRDKLERLQEEYNLKLKSESDVQSEALKTSNKLRDVQALSESQEKTIASLREEVERNKATIEAIQLKFKDAESRAELAEKQYDGLKLTIRSLQEENDDLRKENRVFEERLVAEKGKTVDEMNTLTEMVERLKTENETLKTLKKQDEQRNNGKPLTSWFGGTSKKEMTKSDASPASAKSDVSTTRKFGDFEASIVPTAAKHTIAAHATEGTCVRYDEDADSNLVASASSSDGVKVWDTNSGLQRFMFRASPGQSVMCCDLAGSILCGGGSDRTCRVYNLRTERMVRLLLYRA